MTIPRQKADRCEGGPITLDLTKRDLNKADCQNKCRNLVEKSKPLLLIGSPIDSGRENKERVRGVLHLAFICELHETQLHWVGISFHAHSHSADSWEQPTVVDFTNRFPDTCQEVIDRSLFGPNVPTVEHAEEMCDKFRTRCTGTQLIDPLVQRVPNDHECNVPAIAIRPGCRWNFGSTAASPAFAKAGYPSG